jgi:hypothetical protein
LPYTHTQTHKHTDTQGPHPCFGMLSLFYLDLDLVLYERERWSERAGELDLILSARARAPTHVRAHTHLHSEREI